MLWKQKDCRNKIHQNRGKRNNKYDGAADNRDLLAEAEERAYQDSDANPQERRQSIYIYCFKKRNVEVIITYSICKFSFNR